MLPRHLDHHFWLSVILYALATTALPIPVVVLDNAPTIADSIENHLSNIVSHVVEEERKLVGVIEDSIKACTTSKCYSNWKTLLDDIPGFFQPFTHHVEQASTEAEAPSSSTIPKYLQEILPTTPHKRPLIESNAQDRPLSSSDDTDIIITNLGYSKSPHFSGELSAESTTAIIQAPQTAASTSWLIFRHPSTFVVAILTFIITTFFLICTFKLLRRYCMDPRRRADRAARREEYKRRKMYRSAACRYKIQRFFTAHFTIPAWARRKPAVDTEAQFDSIEKEKQYSLPKQTEEDLSNHVLGSSILSMQDATVFVDNFLRSVPHRGRQTDLRSNVSSDRTETTLPAYSLPPRYSQELPAGPSQVQIIAGFAYTPSNSDVANSSSASSFIIDDNLTESSAIDLDSRLSEDTDSVRS